MSGRRYEQDEDTEPRRVVIGGGGGDYDRFQPCGPVFRTHCNLVGSLLTILILFNGCAIVVMGDSADGSVEIPKNEGIYCYGRGMEAGIGADIGETYPDHLGRLLGAAVGHSYAEFMRPATSSETLEAISYFDDHGYGAIIIRIGYDPDDTPWNSTESNLRSIIRGLQDTGAAVVFFESGPLWDLDGQLTTTDEECLKGTSQAMVHPYIVCDSINSETRTGRYIEIWGETVFSRMAREEGAFFLSDSLLDCLEEGPEGCPPLTALHPDLECDDNLHPNGMGYGVLAERIASYLVGWGLAEYAVDLERLSRDIPGSLVDTGKMIRVLEERGHPPPGDVQRSYEMAEYLFGKGFPYTANRTLEEKVLSVVLPVLGNWNEVQGMFSRASDCIEALKGQGEERKVKIAAADYERAERSWEAYDYRATRIALSRAIAQCPEPLLLPALSLLPLFLLFRGRRGFRNEKLRIGAVVLGIECGCMIAEMMIQG